MKGRIFFLFFTVCVLVMFQANARIYVLGHPKSGNNFLCYSLANMLNKGVLVGSRILFLPTILGDNSDSEEMMSPEWQLEKVREIFDDAIFFEHHSAGLGLNKADQLNDYLVVIVRDYHECFIRSETEGEAAQISYNPEKALAKIRNLRKVESIPNCYDTGAIDLINILRCYDEWNPQTRVLVYYEDLVNDFESTMQDCLFKLNVTDSLFDEFMQHKETLIEYSRTHYQFGKAMSGTDVKYHQKKWLTPDWLVRWTMKLEKTFPITGMYI